MKCHMKSMPLAGSVQRVTRDRMQAGFTVLELLIASVIMIILLTALTGVFVSSSRAYRVTEEISNRQQEIEAAVKVLSYDLQLAGYRGTTPTEVGRLFGAPTLVVEKNDSTTSDRLIVRYFEDSSRLFGGQDSCGSPCVVTYEVGPGDDGVLYLFRQEGSNEEKGIVQAVELFKIKHYVRRGGELVEANQGTPIPNDLAALNIEITFAEGGLWRFPVGVSNPQEMN